MAQSTSPNATYGQPRLSASFHDGKCCATRRHTRTRTLFITKLGATRRRKLRRLPKSCPPPPPPPVPPAEQAPHPATITFSHDNLRIDADNSSLVQILNQVSHADRTYNRGTGPRRTYLWAIWSWTGDRHAVEAARWRRIRLRHRRRRTRQVSGKAPADTGCQQMLRPTARLRRFHRRPLTARSRMILPNRRIRRSRCNPKRRKRFSMN